MKNYKFCSNCEYGILQTFSTTTSASPMIQCSISGALHSRDSVCNIALTTTSFNGDTDNKCVEKSGSAKCTICLNDMTSVLNMIQGFILNDYHVEVFKIVDKYFSYKIDHFEITYWKE